MQNINEAEILELVAQLQKREEVDAAQGANVLPDNVIQGSKYHFNNEADAIAAVSSLCAFVWQRGKLRCALKDENGFWFLTSRKDAEIALAQYRVFLEVEKPVSAKGTRR